MKHLISLSLLVVVYGASWCGYCTIQKKALDLLGIKYTYIDVDKSSHPKLEGLPTLINNNGKSHTGLLQGEELRTFLNEG